MTRIAQARAAIRNKFGARQYRITREGVIHVRGTMPNTNTEGWYVFGAMGCSQTLHSLGLIH